MIDKTVFPLDNAKTLFDICKTEYINEKTRTSIIDTKASIVITLATGLYVFFLDVAKDSFVFFIDEKSISLLMMILLVCTYCSIVFGFMACYYLYKVLRTRQYCMLEPSYYQDIEKLKLDVSLYITVCSEYYKRAVEHNRSVNTRRSQYYNCALKFFCLSLFSIVMHLIILVVT